MSDELLLHTVYADFNHHFGHSLGPSCNGTKADLDRLGLVLRDGLRLRVSDGDWRRSDRYGGSQSAKSG
jgi:hypothetical protein